MKVGDAQEINTVPGKRTVKIAFWGAKKKPSNALCNVWRRPTDMTHHPEAIELKPCVLIMRCKDGWYPIEDNADLPLADKAMAHGMRNAHIESIEDIEGNVLWRRQ